ncbi:MAG: hypothetical protein M3R17_09215 [Bacteroidota bacterium]|nr:hypothetical protein [Bacteroidota bacterium]
MNPYNQPYVQPERESVVITKTLRTALLLFVIVIYLVTLPLDAYLGATDVEGYLCLVLGWAMIVVNVFGFLDWLANLPFVIALFIFALSRKKPAAIVSFVLSFIAFALSLCALLLSDLPISPHSSSGPVSISFGVFAWIFSMATLTLITFLNMKFHKEEIKKKPHAVLNYQQYYQQPYQQNYPPAPPYPEEPTRKGMGDNF